MVQLPGRSTQSIMAVKAEMVVVTIINILEKFDEDELALMMNDHKQDWEGHEMKSESPKQNVIVTVQFPRDQKLKIVGCFLFINNKYESNVQFLLQN